MSKLEELIQELCPDGVEYKILGDIFDIKNGYTPSKKSKSFWENGSVPWFRLEDIRVNGRILTHAIQNVTENAVKNNKFPANSLIISTTATIGEHALVKTEFLCNQQLTCVSIKKDNLNKILIKYCYYYFDIIDEQCKKIANNGGGMAIVSLSKLKELKIAVPPLPVQEEIVRILDNFTELTAELTAELTVRKKQYEYYRDILLSHDKSTSVYKLSDIAQYSKSKIDAKEVDENSYIGVDNLLQNKKGKTVSSYVPLEGRLTKYNPGDILIGNIRPYLRKIWFSDNEGGTNGDVLTIQVISDKVLPRYLFFQLSSEDFFSYDIKNSKGAKMPRGNKDAIMRYKIPVPSIEKQQQIVDILDRFDKLCNDISEGLPAEIEARQKQYEYYRDKLLTFKPLEEEK